MKILIAIHGFPPTYYAGSERAAERIAQWLVEHGHHVEIFACEKLDAPDTHIETATENGMIIHRFSYNLKDGDYFQNLYDDPRIGVAFRNILAQNTFDVVHIVSGYLLGGQVIHAAKEAGVPVVLTLTEFWFMCFRLNLLKANNEMCVGPDTDEKCMRCVMEDQRRYRLPAQKAPVVMDAFWSVAKNIPFAQARTHAIAERRHILQSALEAIDVVICPSQFIINKFSEYQYDTSRFVHIRHGIKTRLDMTDAQPNDSDGTLRLGYMGQIKLHKGIDLLIDAVLPLLNQGKMLTVNIWGPLSKHSSYEIELEQRTNQYKSIRWAGGYTNEQLRTVLSSFDVLIVPSRWYENSPAVILEAQASGRPVIATRLGGMKELVQHEKNGLLFELNNAQDLSSQINRLFDEPELLAQLRANIPDIPASDDEVSAIYAHYQKLTGKV